MKVSRLGVKFSCSPTPQPQQPGIPATCANSLWQQGPINRLIENRDRTASSQALCWFLNPLNHHQIFFFFDRLTLVFWGFVFFWGGVVLFCFCFLGLHLLHMEVPRLGLKLELQLHSHSNVGSKLRLRPSPQLTAVADGGLGSNSHPHRY